MCHCVLVSVKWARSDISGAALIMNRPTDPGGLCVQSPTPQQPAQRSATRRAKAVNSKTTVGVCDARLQSLHEAVFPKWADYNYTNSRRGYFNPAANAVLNAS